jgi:ATP-binding cassette subfamily B protein
MKYNVIVSEADSKATGVLSDAVGNQNTITLFTTYKKESIFFKEVTDDQSKKMRLSWNLGEIIDFVQFSFIYFVEFIVFYYAIFFWEKNAITIGTFVLIQVYIIGLAQQLKRVNQIIRGIHESIADAKEMVEILETPHEIKDSPMATNLTVQKGLINFNNVTFSFNQTREVVSGLNLEIKEGEKVALVGHSGAGKTTLIRLLLRLYDLTAGSITIDGQNIAQVTQESLHKNISLVPQEPVLFHRSLMENIRYGRADATDEEVIEAAKLAHCDIFIDALPLKYETLVGERGIKLSGGERQRVAIARAILKNAPILILDEATSSLDSQSEGLIQDAFDTLMKNCTTIVIAHRLSTIRKMDRIIGLENGAVIEQGTHEELSKKENGLYANLWKLQVSGFIAE